MTNLEQLRLAAIEAYLETGKYQSAKQLAERTGLPVWRVRKLVADEGHGALGYGMTAIEDHEQTFSRSYRNWEHGSVRVTKHGPCTYLLREALLAAALCEGLRALNKGPTDVS